MHNNNINNNNNYYTNDLNDPNDDENEPCNKKLLPSLFAWFLLISTTSSYFTLVFPMYYDLLGQNRFYLFMVIAIAHGILFFYVLINFSIATFMDPGRFPKIDIGDNGEGISKPLNSTNYKNVLINDINVRMKWCTTCQFYRPPRSSHCAVCNSCIDTMDHHCPWVSNCIGRRNYKYFFSFLISLTLHMLVILSLSLTLVLMNKENLANIPIMTAILLIILIAILIIPIGGLTGFHIILVSRGRTTNEQVTGKFRTGVNPFDEGFLSNCAKILFSSTPPSFIKFRKKQMRLQEFYQTKLLLQKYSKASVKQKAGHMVRGGESAKIITAQRYKNPNFHANNKPITSENKRIRKYQVNNHNQNELELKLNNYLNQDERETNFSSKIDEQHIKESQKFINKKQNYNNNNDYDNQIDPHKFKKFDQYKGNKNQFNDDLESQKYTRNYSYTNANQLVENLQLLPEESKSYMNDYVRDQFYRSKKQQMTEKNSKRPREFNENKIRQNSNKLNKDSADYNSYEITV